jgi:hypothetical protein
MPFANVPPSLDAATDRFTSSTTSVAHQVVYVDEGIAKLRVLVTQSGFDEASQLITDLTSVVAQAKSVLAQLLQIECRNLDADTRRHPATSALRSNLAEADSQCSIVVISQRNHDAEALAFNTFICARKGHAVITV